MKKLYSGNEAIARGAYEAGVKVASGYPGTPSTEILENIVKYKDDIYCEWAPNEKVAFEGAVGASLTHVRTICTQKLVGLNVAADPFMSFTYMGAEGGFICVVADDPGMHSSQNEQDSRHYARFAKIPVLEPTNSQECKDCVLYGMELSEKYRTPVMLRTTTRVAHSRGLVEEGERIETGAPHFDKIPMKYSLLPVRARQLHIDVEKRLVDLMKEASASPFNRIEWAENGDRKLGIIACGIAYEYVKEVWRDTSVLKLGFSFPFPDDLLREFANGVEEVLVVEELDSFVEEHLRGLDGLTCKKIYGKDIVPLCGELFTENLWKVRQKLDGTVQELPSRDVDVKSLPARPPVLCAGCPHRGIFFPLSKMDVVITGDIGCYTLGMLPPLNAMDTVLCMGGGISVAHGIAKAGEKKPVVGIVGDSTFFHSGMTSLSNIIYNNSNVTIIVLDNRITAMTGHQDNPGTGVTLMGEQTVAADIESIGRALGMKNVVTLDPFDQKTVVETLKKATQSPEPWLIISRSPCLLKTRKPQGTVRVIDPDKCKKCGSCLKLGCPAIESTGKGTVPSVNTNLCSGCSLCNQTCKFNAISNS
ncbi:MAG: indolepyruvate ferredoxin oxidoreductase subunit alpha [Thermoguttaceae bacterium]|nr:indolepyruvate ferredoxin oxidoreductase subunit alpha [Thermoguttaceae bacterium]